MSTRRLSMISAALVLAVTVAATAASPPPAPVKTNGLHAKEVRQIQILNDKWDVDVATRNLDGLIASYAKDGIAFPQNRPPVRGQAALRAYWGGLLALPDFHFDTTDTQIHVSKSGDMAWIAGDYVLSFTSPNGKVEDLGKYLLIYEKINGEWKLVLDIDNSNGRG